MKNLLKLLVILVCFGIFAQAQTAEDKKVEIRQQIGSRYFRCFQAENKVYNVEDFKKLTADKDCSETKILKVDFAKQSLIGYETRGDCFVRGDAKVFRNDSTKTYKIKITNYWGGCRAGGVFAGWIVIDKIPDDYKVEFNEIRADRLPNDPDHYPLETREIDLKGCIQTIFTKQFVIKDEAEYLKAIRNDASRNYCLKNLEKIDFTKNSLLGININSGYCRRPAGLEYEISKTVR
ncbi:MAG: hypothetical protein K1X72_05365 [Pyrinomonadaceae bacterium]|nr:hypothetical protein [Pyrinomonadaceae bacterium]